MQFNAVITVKHYRNIPLYDRVLFVYTHCIYNQLFERQSNMVSLRNSDHIMAISERLG